MRKFLALILTLTLVATVGLGVAAANSDAEAGGDFTLDLSNTSSYLTWTEKKSSVSGFSQAELNKGFAEFGRMGFLTAGSISPYYVVASIEVTGGPTWSDNTAVDHRLAIKSAVKDSPSGQLVTTGSIDDSWGAYDNFTKNRADGGQISGYLGVNDHTPTVMQNQAGAAGNNGPDKANIFFAMDASSGDPADQIFADAEYTVTMNYVLTAP